MAGSEQADPSPAPGVQGPSGAARGGSAPSIARALAWISFGLVVLRIAYHATYLGEVPFALGTFSDGAIYEAAAIDIVEHPPLGTEPFYLQGAYAYLLALGMSIRPWPALGLLGQLVVAALALIVAHRSFVRLWGPQVGRVSTIVLLACPALAFYENKFLSASLGVACNVLAFAAFVVLARASGRRRAWQVVAFGLASGLAMLARPNMVLALPFALVALDRLTRDEGLRAWSARSARAALFVLGVGLALAPMAARNLVVTGHPDLAPVHGGGTSFFIGNNPAASGLWNPGGLLSANLGTERSELAEQLEIDPALAIRDQSRAIGDALYRRSLAWISANPGAWLQLELRKLYFTIGNQELTQDYDWLGEQELIPWAHRVALPFGLLLALALVGGVVVARREYEVGEGSTRALGVWLTGQLVAVLAANLIFFTSAQHRLPLVVPLAILAGPGLVALVERGHARVRRSSATPRLGPWVVFAALLIAVQAIVPRIPRTTPHPVHYFNLALVQDDTGDPRGALRSLDRAIELRPNDPIFHGERAHLRYRLVDLDGAEQDLAIVLANPNAPAWVRDQAERDAMNIIWVRRNAAAQGERELLTP